jgi:hypothetical protein
MDAGVPPFSNESSQVRIIKPRKDYGSQQSSVCPSTPRHSVGMAEMELLGRRFPRGKQERKPYPGPYNWAHPLTATSNTLSNQVFGERFSLYSSCNGLPRVAINLELSP